MASPPLRASDLSSSSPSITPHRERMRNVGTPLSISITHTDPKRVLTASSSREEALARDAVTKFEQQLMQKEELFGHSCREAEGRRPSKALTPSGAGDTSGIEDGGRARGKEYVEDSDDEDLYNSHVARRIRAFLDSIKEEDFTCNPSPVDAMDMDANGEGIDEEALHQQQLKRATVDEILRIAAEAQRELLIALFDAITLETELTEMREDAAVLERAVSHREETVEVLKMQLSIADEYNEELYSAKREALRKLSDAKTEIALLSQRNATVSTQLQEKEKELQLSLARSANHSARVSPPAPERRDEGTITTTELHSVLIAAPASAGVPNNGSLSTPFFPMQHRECELEAMLRKLQLVCDTLQSTENARTDLNELRRQLSIGVRESRSDAAACGSASSDVGIPQPRGERCAPTGPQQRLLRRRVDDVAHYTDSLESDIPMLWTKARAQPAESSGLASASATSPEGQGGRGGCAEPADSNLAFLQQQLDRAQADARRLESELRAEREKSQRQSAAEKKLLENVAYLTQKLRAREALDRETRLQRRASLYPHHFSPRDSAGVRRGVGTAAGDVSGEGAPPSIVSRASQDPDAAGMGTATAATRKSRANSQELRQRRESVFAALRDARKASDERRSSHVENTRRNSDGQTSFSSIPLTSSSRDAAPAALKASGNTVTGGTRGTTPTLTSSRG
ncbi:conserved hypothetical protein [Leishmania mexicana MHOM/GT/2001/U1103]|uniref:Uncharacterized protein n=1 Tax=Leishmania mexicana (strain MHOM/GT/2001/U1103) TaxID=929439 RepID=E9AM33_LEIMU|nr:conserved hypothetical protein [Leishmania mexicana MHOM/GT/2001/U1103]CBZ23988.1 conserved hypothetical protein [Leishmania mexicana MHOM/GT/2001/U1103]